MKKADLFFNVLRLPVDFSMLLAAGLTTYLLRTRILDDLRPVLFDFNLPLFKYFYLVFFAALIFIGAYAVSGLYSMKVRMSRLEEFLKITVASSAAIMTLIIYIFLRQELFDSRFLVLGGWFFAIIFVTVGRSVIRSLQRFYVSRRNFGIHRVLVIGDDEISARIIDDINKNPQSGYRIAKHLSNPEISEIGAAIRSPGVDPERSREGSQRTSASYGVDEVFLVNPNYPAQSVMELIDFCNEHHLVFKFVPNVYQALSANIDIDSISGLPLIELRRTALDGWGRVAKRTIDIFTAVMGLIILAPLFVLVAFAIKLETAGPVFVRLKRVSRNRKFGLIKFRSMIKNAEELKASLAILNERQDGPLFKIKNDPRVTWVGRFIRKYRIDEFPQLWNVVKGDISLVGPRPHQPDEIEKYQKHHKRVLAINAGATGLAQVSGSSDLPFEQEVALDTFYIENWSLFMDLKIILKTAFKIFTDRSAV